MQKPTLDKIQVKSILDDFVRFLADQILNKSGKLKEDSSSLSATQEEVGEAQKEQLLEGR